MTARTPDVLAEVAAERDRQDARWGEQNHQDLPVGPPWNTWSLLGAAIEALSRDQLHRGATWAPILMEEVGEAFQARSRDQLRAELVQVAAVAVSWVEAIDRRPTLADPVRFVQDSSGRWHVAATDDGTSVACGQSIPGSPLVRRESDGPPATWCWECQLRRAPRPEPADPDDVLP